MNEQEYIQKVCDNVKSLRIQRDLTQLAFAEQIGIEDSALRRIESGRTSPTLKTLYRIAIASKIDLKELLPDLNIQES